MLMVGFDVAQIHHFSSCCESVVLSFLLLANSYGEFSWKCSWMKNSCRYLFFLNTKHVYAKIHCSMLNWSNTYCNSKDLIYYPRLKIIICSLNWKIFFQFSTYERDKEVWAKDSSEWFLIYRQQSSLKSKLMALLLITRNTWITMVTTKENISICVFSIKMCLILIKDLITILTFWIPLIL